MVLCFCAAIRAESVPGMSGLRDAQDELRKKFITNHDLCEMLRLQGRIADPAGAKLATLERNGQISAIPRQL